MADHLQTALYHTDLCDVIGGDDFFAPPCAPHMPSEISDSQWQAYFKYRLERQSVDTPERDRVRLAWTPFIFQTPQKQASLLAKSSDQVRALAGEKLAGEKGEKSVSPSRQSFKYAPQKISSPLALGASGASAADESHKIIDHIQILAHQSTHIDQIVQHIETLQTHTQWQKHAVCPVFLQGNLQSKIVLIKSFPEKEAEDQRDCLENIYSHLFMKQALAYISRKPTDYIEMNGFFWRPLMPNVPDSVYDYSLPFCKKALALLNPEKIIFAGAKIAQIFLETKEPLMALRQKKHALSCYDTPIDAYVTFQMQEIEGASMKKLFWQDMLFAFES